MKNSILFLAALFAFVFFKASAEARDFLQPKRSMVQLIRAVPKVDGQNSVYFSASAPGRPIYDIYCENCCGFIGYDWESPSFEAGLKFKVLSVNRFRSGGPPSPYHYNIVWRFLGGRLQCSSSRPPEADYANRLMRGYIRVSQ